MSAKEVWIVGDWHSRDFAETLAWLHEQAEPQCYSDAESALAVSRSSAGRAAPAAILIMQSRPGQISHRAVERLHAVAPLARLVGLVGPWCEGELRSGRPWPGVSRVPWRDWRWRLARELGVDDGPLSMNHRLARTTSDTDRLQQSIANVTRGRRFSGRAEVLTTNHTNYESWRGALRELGIQSYCPPIDAAPHATGDLQLIDGWENVRDVASTVDLLPRILALHFPRPEDVNRAASLGITRVIGLPFLLADFAVALSSILPVATNVTRESAA